MKKNVLLLCLLLFFALLLPGCTSAPKDDGKLHIISTIFAPYDFARNICGEDCAVSMLLTPGVDIHAYEPTPQDIISIRECDLFIYVGGESDAWVDELLASLDGVRTLRLTDCVALLDEEHVEGMESENDAHSHEDAEPDEHVWTAPDNAVEITRAIGAALCELLPENADEIAARVDAYTGELEALDAHISEIVSNAQRNTLIFADRFPMRYFTQHYGLSYFAAFPGCASNTEPSAAVVTFLIDKVNQEGIPAVFYTEFSNQKMADTICEATGAQKLRMHSCHNVSQADFDRGVSYLSLMYENAQALEKALGSAAE